MQLEFGRWTDGVLRHILQDLNATLSAAVEEDCGQFKSYSCKLSNNQSHSCLFHVHLSSLSRANIGISVIVATP
jgi:hypothetical protein